MGACIISVFQKKIHNNIVHIMRSPLYLLYLLPRTRYTSPTPTTIHQLLNNRNQRCSIYALHVISIIPIYKNRFIDNDDLLNNDTRASLVNRMHDAVRAAGSIMYIILYVHRRQMYIILYAASRG